MTIRLHRDNGVLKDNRGDHFQGLIPTAFLLCSPEKDWEYVKQYIDDKYNKGAQGFRAVWNCFWGPDSSGSHGGNTVYWLNKPALIERTRKVLDYLSSKKMYLFLEMLDSSLIISIGQAYFARSQAWIELFQTLVDLNSEFSNIIIGTGNEPSKGKDPDKVKDWQEWAVTAIRELAEGDPLLIAGEINQGTGVPDLVFNEGIDIWGWKTPRWDNVSVIQGTYNQLKMLHEGKHPDIPVWTGLKTGRVIWGHEPPRRNYPNDGDWCSDIHKEWLRKIMYCHLGSIYTPHGLGNGQEEHQPSDWGGDHQHLWGVGDEDWLDLYAGFNTFVKTLKSPPAGPKALTKYDFIPDNGSWFIGAGQGFRTKDDKFYVIVAAEDGIQINIAGGPGRFRVVNLITGLYEWEEHKKDLNFTTTQVKDKIIFISRATEDVPNP